MGLNKEEKLEVDLNIFVLVDKENEHRQIYHVYLIRRHVKHTACTNNS